MGETRMSRMQLWWFKKIRERMGLLLLLILILPLAGAIIGAFLPAASAKGWALLVSVVTAAAALGIASSFNFTQSPTSPAAAVQIQWPESGASFAFNNINLQFHLGVDSISLWLVLLTVLLMPLALLASFEAIKDRQKEYYAWMLVLMTAMNGVFLARDLLLFY